MSTLHEGFLILLRFLPSSNPAREPVKAWLDYWNGFLNVWIKNLKNKAESLAICRVLEPSGQDLNWDVSRDAHNIDNNLQNCHIFNKNNWQRKCQKKGPGFCKYHRLPSTGYPGSREETARVTHMVQTRGIKKKNPSWLPRKRDRYHSDLRFLCVNNVQSYSIRTVKDKEPRSYHRHEWQHHIHHSSLRLWDELDWQHFCNPYHHTPNDKTRS